MIDERGIAYRYLSAQKKRSTLLIFGVVLAIALISAVFSILNVVQQYEVTLQSENGVWHVQANGCTQKQAGELARRIDVSASGRIVYVQKEVTFGGKVDGVLRGCDADGAKQSNFVLNSGRLPAASNEIALEQWALKKIKPGAAVGDAISVKFADKSVRTFVLSGILRDNSQRKGSEYCIAAISLDEAKQLASTDKVTVLMQVKDGLDVDKFAADIENDQHIGKSSVWQHTGLLAALGRSKNSSAVSVYIVGGFLALLVIFSAIMMIYNAFNISVTQRVRQFGLLRAMGATPEQIRKIVRSEAAIVSLLGVIPGLVLGIIVTTALTAFLRIAVPEYFPPEGPLFCISWISLAIGALTGVLSTVFSSLEPARKAGKVSPVEAMAATAGKAIRKKSAKGIATRIIPVEAALSLRRLMVNKKSFVLTALSLSFGILLMLCFSPVTGMIREGAEHNYDLGDMYVAAPSEGAGFSDSLIQSLSKTDGVKEISSKKICSVDATFDYSLLGKEYRDSVASKRWESVARGGGNTVAAPSKSTLIGLSDSDIARLKSKLVFGNTDARQLNSENGVILALNNQGSVNISDLRPGEYIIVNNKKMKICGIIKKDAVMFIYNDNPFIGMYTTNEVLSGVAGVKPNLLTVTLNGGADSDAVFEQVRNAVSGIKNVQAGNQNEAKSMADKITLVANVFIYGFVAVIALIGILNIINTMSTNVLVRTREIGLLRAGGMTMGQVFAMIASESALYGLLALIIGLAAGIPLEHLFFNMTVKDIYSLPWTMPWNLVVISSVITLAAVMASIVSPLRRIGKIVITQAVTVD